MKKNIINFILFIGILFCFSACFVNERGVSNRFYDDCKSYYDASGTYHETCPQNWVEVPLTPKALKQ